MMEQKIIFGLSGRKPVRDWARHINLLYGVSPDDARDHIDAVESILRSAYEAGYEAGVSDAQPAQQPAGDPDTFKKYDGHEELTIGDPVCDTGGTGIGVGPNCQ